MRKRNYINMINGQLMVDFNMFLFVRVRTIRPKFMKTKLLSFARAWIVCFRAANINSIVFEVTLTIVFTKKIIEEKL